MQVRDSDEEATEAAEAAEEEAATAAAAAADEDDKARPRYQGPDLPLETILLASARACGKSCNTLK